MLCVFTISWLTLLAIRLAILAVALAWLCQCLGNLLMRIHMLGLIFRLTWRKKDKQKSR